MYKLNIHIVKRASSLKFELETRGLPRSNYLGVSFKFIKTFSKDITFGKAPFLIVGALKSAIFFAQHT